MNNQKKKYELIKFEDGDFSLDVSVSPDEETVWLTQEQIAILYQKSRSTITEHINNIFSEGELESMTSVGISDGSNHRPAKLYNLEVVLAVGYRVKSRRGIIFRRWATSILKQYLLKGYSINEKRCLSCTTNILSLQNDFRKIKERLDNLEESIYSSESIVYEGEILEPYTFLRKLFFLAKKEITIIDYYADKFLLSMLPDIKAKIEIITSSCSYLNKENLPNNITIKVDDNAHDRSIFIDDVVYVIGTSFNSIGKGKFVMIRLYDTDKESFLKQKRFDN